jgi:hypothetical protein
VDTIKGDHAFDAGYLTSHTTQFAASWLSALVRNPGSFVNAYLLETFGYWKPAFEPAPLPLPPDIVTNGLGLHRTDLVKRVTGRTLAPVFDALARSVVWRGWPNIAWAVWTAFLSAAVLISLGKARYVLGGAVLHLARRVRHAVHGVHGDGTRHEDADARGRDGLRDQRAAVARPRRGPRVDARPVPAVLRACAHAPQGAARDQARDPFVGAVAPHDISRGGGEARHPRAPSSAPGILARYRSGVGVPITHPTDRHRSNVGSRR